MLARLPLVRKPTGKMRPEQWFACWTEQGLPLGGRPPAIRRSAAAGHFGCDGGSGFPLAPAAIRLPLRPDLALAPEFGVRYLLY
jgi:hypothetical protein